MLFDIQTPEPATVADNTNEEVVTEEPSSENTNTAENLAPVDVEAPSSETTDNSNTAQTDTPATNAPEIDVDNTDADRSTTDNAEESPDTAAAQPHFTVGGGSADSGLFWLLLLATLAFRARRKSLLDHHLMS